MTHPRSEDALLGDLVHPPTLVEAGAIKHTPKTSSRYDVIFRMLEENKGHGVELVFNDPRKCSASQNNIMKIAPRRGFNIKTQIDGKTTLKVWVEERKEK